VIILKAKNLIKILNREKDAEITICGKPISGFNITYSCDSNGEWYINLEPKQPVEEQKNIEN